MMPGTEGGAGGRGRPLTALGGALAASDTITPPGSSCVPVVGSCRTSGDQLGLFLPVLPLVLVFGGFFYGRRLHSCRLCNDLPKLPSKQRRKIESDQPTRPQENLRAERWRSHYWSLESLWLKSDRKTAVGWIQFWVEDSSVLRGFSPGSPWMVFQLGSSKVFEVLMFSPSTEVSTF